MHYPLMDIQADFKINRPVRNELPRKEIISTDDVQADRRTDGRTDVAHDNNWYFFRKKKKILKTW